jgi:hypothetical protein
MRNSGRNAAGPESRRLLAGPAGNEERRALRDIVQQQVNKLAVFGSAVTNVHRKNIPVQRLFR